MIHFYIYIPENIRKTFGLLFSGFSENIGLKWVSFYNYELLVSKNIYFILFPSSSKHFSTIMCFFTPWKHKESFSFMMFSRGLEMHPWSKIGSFYIFGTSGFILSENGTFLWNLVIFNPKGVFYKIENLVGATFYLRNNLLKVKFLGVIHHNKMHK